MDPMTAVHQGFQTISADATVKEKAEQHLHTWLTNPEFLPYRPQIEKLIETGKWSVLLDSFYQVLPFGTGGRRGAVGIGPNRMNLWTLGASVQGHCEYLKQRFPGVATIVVVLAYDVRRFLDVRGVYDATLPNPIYNLTSRDFCRKAAGVYAANGIHSFILPEDTRRYMSTPELSYTIRFLNAHGGLNMTASHNPPDDNGSKFYDERGAQPVPPEDQIMSDLVDQVPEIRQFSWVDAIKSGKVHFLDAAAYETYIELCRKQSLVPAPKTDEIRVVYTPLHGVGGFSAGHVLEAQGFRPIIVSQQAEPDGRFPNVTKSPNPEVPESMDLAEKLARERQADLVISTDPDADRLGGMACETADGKGNYRFLTGQEIAVLLTHFKLSRLSSAGDLPASPIVITTEVTTGQLTRVARHFGAQMVNDLLVGFKYHADVLKHLETSGQYGDIKGTTADFVIALEESHGTLTTDQIRDKDAAGAALLLAELALHLKRQGRTIPELLNDLANQFGYFRNELLNIVMTGIEGKQDMAKMLDAIRADHPKEIGGIPVIHSEDLWNEHGRMGPFKGETDRSARNFLIFRLNDGKGLEAKVCLRPSGTEPKAKAYLEVCSAPRKAGTSDAEWDAIRTSVDSAIQRIATDFLNRAMATVGKTPTPGADKVGRR